MSEKETFDIVKLIEKNPVLKLSSNYNNRLILRIKEAFTDENKHK